MLPSPSPRFLPLVIPAQRRGALDPRLRGDDEGKGCWALLDLAARRRGLRAEEVDRAAGAAPVEGAAGRTSPCCVVCEWLEGAVSDPARPHRDQTRMPGAARIPAGNLLCSAFRLGEAWAVIHGARHLPGRGLGATPRLQPAARTDRVGLWREPQARRAGGRLASPAPDPGWLLTYLVCFVNVRVFWLFEALLAHSCPLPQAGGGCMRRALRHSRSREWLGLGLAFTPPRSPPP